MTLNQTLEDSQSGSGMDPLGKNCFCRVFDTLSRTLKLTLGSILLKTIVFLVNITSPVEDSEIDSEVVPTGNHYFCQVFQALIRRKQYACQLFQGPSPETHCLCEVIDAQNSENTYFLDQKAKKKSAVVPWRLQLSTLLTTWRTLQFRSDC